MNFDAKLCGEVLLQCRHFGVILHPINRKHKASLLVSRLLCLFMYTEKDPTFIDLVLSKASKIIFNVCKMSLTITNGI